LPFKKFAKKILLIDDTPQKIAAGFGLGVCLGIFPGTGAVAAVFLAWLFKFNRISAILGSLLVNTWLSIVIFFLALKVGAFMTGRPWQEVYRHCGMLLGNLKWAQLLKASYLQLILPLALGYLLVSATAGMLVYIMVLPLAIFIKKRRKLRV
jgi:uncharacterized protein (DUF2062 family)